jgi:hypothetical protein
MKKTIIKISVLLLLFSAYLPAFSQEEEDEPRKIKNYSVSIHPQSLLWGGIKTHFDMRIKKKQWVTVMPTVYLFSGINSFRGWGGYDGYYDSPSIENSKGFGLDLGYKYFFGKNEIVYVRGEIGNHFFRVKYSEYNYIPFYEDEMLFYKYDKVNATANFDKVAAALAIGINTGMWHGVYCDFYLGVGYQYAFYKDSDKFTTSHNYVYSFTNRGYYPALGISIGYAW